jgi:hypothetical protein
MFKFVKELLEIVLLLSKVAIICILLGGGYFVYEKFMSKEEKLPAVIVENIVITVDEDFNNHKSLLRQIQEKIFKQPVEFVRIVRGKTLGLVIDANAPKEVVNAAIQRELCSFYSNKLTLSRDLNERRALQVVVGFFCSS